MKWFALLFAALLLTNCCVMGSGCAPPPGASLAGDQLGSAAADDPDPVKPPPDKRSKRETVPREVAVIGQDGKSKFKDSWEQQQAIDQADEARLKRKLTICRSCLVGESPRDDATSSISR